MQLDTISGPASVRTVKRWRGPAFAKSKTGLKVADTLLEVRDMAFVERVLALGDEADIPGLVSSIVILSIHVENGIIPARKRLNVPKECRTIFTPLRPHCDASPPVVLVVF